MYVYSRLYSGNTFERQATSHQNLTSVSSPIQCVWYLVTQSRPLANELRNDLAQPWLLSNFALLSLRYPLLAVEMAAEWAAACEESGAPADSDAAG